MFLLACVDDPVESKAPVEDEGPSTPESVVASAQEGDAVRVRGVVHALTYDSTAPDDSSTSATDASDAWSRLDGRWLLLRSELPVGVSWEEQSMSGVVDDASVLLGWGLGVWLEMEAPRPRIDEEVELVGSFAWSTWNGHPVPIVEDAELTRLAPEPAAAEGEACENDDDCLEQFVCSRAGRVCALPAEEGWASAFRDVDGSCTSDEDCPIGQFCDSSFAVPDSGEYTWRYDGTTKAGRFLCVPESEELDLACPRVWSVRDLAGGRFVEGREFCVEGKVQLIAGAADGDSHVQLQVDEPIPYPAMDAHVYFFGGTTEIGPPHKNPERPQGAVVDPDWEQTIIALGTYRWDGGHGWFEQHPVKAWWPSD